VLLAEYRMLEKLATGTLPSGKEKNGWNYKYDVASE
jgi:hypothetical protein